MLQCDVEYSLVSSVFQRVDQLWLHLNFHCRHFLINWIQGHTWSFSFRRFGETQVLYLIIKVIILVRVTWIIRLCRVHLLHAKTLHVTKGYKERKSQNCQPQHVLIRNGSNTEEKNFFLLCTFGRLCFFHLLPWRESQRYWSISNPFGFSTVYKTNLRLLF